MDDREIRATALQIAHLMGEAWSPSELIQQAMKLERYIRTGDDGEVYDKHLGRTVSPPGRTAPEQ